MAYKYTAYVPSDEVTKAKKKSDDSQDYYNNNYVLNHYKVGDGGFGKQYNTANNRLTKLYNNNNLSQQFKYSKPGLYNKARKDVINRKPFSYDMDEDMLFQQAKSQFQAMGKTAMTDTIGQASALTGGYGNSYATTAGAQAYNSYLQDLNNSVGDYYAMALSTYNSETDRLNNVFNTLSADRNSELNEWSQGWNVYNNLYSMYLGERDNAAQLDLNSYQTQSDNAYKIANMYADNYKTVSGNDLSKYSTQEGLKAEEASQIETEHKNRADEAYQDKVFEETVRSNKKSERQKARELRLAKKAKEDEDDPYAGVTPKQTDKTDKIIQEIIDEQNRLKWTSGSTPIAEVAEPIIEKYANSKHIDLDEVLFLCEHYGIIL